MGRIVYVDISKVMCTLLVVFAHLYSVHSIERLFIYSFHMPFFFIISGMFHKEMNFQESLNKNFRQLIVPTLFYILIYIVVCVPFISFYKKGIFSFNDFYLQFKELISGFFKGNESAMPNGYVWFLIVLFYLKTFSDYLNEKKLTNQWKFLSCYFFVFIVCSFVKPHYLFIGQAIISFPFYYIGKCAKKEILELRLSSSRTKIIRLLFCLSMFFVVPVLNGKVSVVGINFGKLFFPMNVLLFYVGAFVGSMLVLDLASYLRFENKYISKVSKSLITIVGLQGIFTKFYDVIIGKDQIFIVSLFTSIIIMCICVEIHQLLIKNAKWIFGKN